MTTGTEYNGWTNYAKWRVNLWLDNEQGAQAAMIEQATELLQAAVDDDESEPKSAAQSALADYLKEMHSESAPKLVGSSPTLMSAALSAVNWREIAGHYIDGIDIYAAGWNMPGYMPDSEPAMFLDAGDALEYIREEIARAVEESDNDLRGDDEWIASLKADRSGEFGQTFGDYHYFVSKV